MELKQLEALLELLRENGVSRYECNGTVLVLGPEPPVHGDDEPSARPGELIRVRPGSETSAHGVYAHPSLWPSGEPPSFPKKST